MKKKTYIWPRRRCLLGLVFFVGPPSPRRPVVVRRRRLPPSCLRCLSLAISPPVVVVVCPLVVVVIPHTPVVAPRYHPASSCSRQGFRVLFMVVVLSWPSCLPPPSHPTSRGSWQWWGWVGGLVVDSK